MQNAQQTAPAIPVPNIDLDLTAFSAAVSNWVGTFWPLMVFLLAIPVCFMIIRYVKDTFFA